MGCSWETRRAQGRGSSCSLVGELGAEKLELEQNVDGRMGLVGQEGAEGSRGIPGRRLSTTSAFF